MSDDGSSSWRPNFDKAPQGPDADGGEPGPGASAPTEPVNPFGESPLPGPQSYGPQSYGPQSYGPGYGPQSYGPQSYGPGYGPGYGPQGYGYPAAPQTDGSAIAALVCSIASFAICPVVPAVVALFLAHSSDAAIRASNGAKTGKGLTRAARIIAWINIGLSAVGLILVVAGLVAFGGSASHSTTYN